MSKQITLSLFLLLLFTGLVAQEVTLDKPKLEAGRLKPDSNFVNFLLQTATAYSNNIEKNDSAEMFFDEAIAIAEKINYAKALIAARENLGQYYFLKGKLSPSLNLLLKNEAKEIETADSAALFNTLRMISTIYMKIGDLSMLKTSLNRRQQILDNNGIKGIKDTSYAVLSQYNSLAQFYNLPQINKLDSAEYYFRKMYGLGKNTAAANLWAQLGNGGLGKCFTSRGQFDSAIYHYKIAIVAALRASRFDNYYAFTVSLADAYKKGGQLDSAYHYAYSVYNDAARYSYASLIASSAGLLAGLFKQQQRYDSAVKYMAIESQYKDSIYGQEALKNIQSLTSNQQLKEQEKQREKEEAVKEYKATLKNYFFIGGLLLLLLIIIFLFRANKQREQSKKKIENSYNELKSTQQQLIQSEKMASLGELTAGIAHEIQNPLNFVNNFSEVSNELMDELNEELNKGDIAEAKTIGNDIKQNLEKINHHGKRADAIVKGMLQHSRQTSTAKEPTNINALCDEYLRLAYHGLRAKDKGFNATLKTDYDHSIGTINIIPQDIGRVMLNLITNAFYAVNEKKTLLQAPGNSYEPTVSVSTKKINNTIEIIVSDNGNGIPQNVLNKIFQPFFTTKPTGQGTGLGLSLAYDIVKAHGGELQVETKEREGTAFTIKIPISQ